MHDVPYLRGAVGPEIVAAMAAVAREVRRGCARPLGAQLLAGAGREALAVALAAGLDFIRVEGFVFAHVADEGLLQACAGELLRYRRAIGAERIAVWADIKKKHCSHAITADQDIVEAAEAAEFFLADAGDLTGRSTGAPADLEELARVKAAVGLPVVVGSGVTVANVHEYLPHADALIVGSHFKEQGHWTRPVERAASSASWSASSRCALAEPPPLLRRALSSARAAGGEGALHRVHRLAKQGGHPLRDGGAELGVRRPAGTLGQPGVQPPEQRAEERVTRAGGVGHLQRPRRRQALAPPRVEPLQALPAEGQHQVLDPGACIQAPITDGGGAASPTSASSSSSVGVARKTSCTASLARSLLSTEQRARSRARPRAH